MAFIPLSKEVAGSALPIHYGRLRSLLADLEGIRTSGARRRWITTLDDVAEEHCLAMHGKTAGLQELFDTPAGSEGRAPLHPRWRCTEVLVFDE